MKFDECLSGAHLALVWGLRLEMGGPGFEPSAPA